MKYYVSILSLVATTWIGCSSNKNKMTLSNTSDGKTVQKVFNQTGNVSVEQIGNVVNGKFMPNGLYKEYYPSGQLKKLAFKSNNTPIGNYYIFYQTGQIDSINIKKGPRTYYSVVFNAAGEQINEDKDFEIRYSDTADIGKPVPVAIKVPLYAGMTTKVSETLFHQSTVIWDTNFSESSNFPLTILSLFNEGLLVTGKGGYKLNCHTTYIDNKTEKAIGSQKKSIDTYAY